MLIPSQMLKDVSHFIGIGFLAGVLAIIAIRFVGMDVQKATHFHANFAVFIDGRQRDFSSDRYMQDVQGCKAIGAPVFPEDRTHLHNNVGDVIHVHDEGVTWGHFFANIGYQLGSNYLVDDTDTISRNIGQKSVVYILNGEVVKNPSNQLIKSEDRLLISYGNDPATYVLEHQYPLIAGTAHEHNQHPDPGSCSGDISLGFWDRLKKSLWW
ncbi:MAG: hypothetical protein Q8P95_00960 [bacterium]|nr:hypothetical protein [bacterium]